MEKVILVLLVSAVTLSLFSSTITPATMPSLSLLNNKLLSVEKDAELLTKQVNDFIFSVKEAYGSVLPIPHDSNNIYDPDATSDDPFKLLSVLSEVAFVGDIGTGTNGIKTVDALLVENPDLVVFLGDMGYSSSITLFSNQVNKLRNAGIDVMCTIGNHDSDEGESDTTELNYWNLCSGGTAGQGFWKVIDDQLTIIGVNTQCDGNSGHSRASCNKTTIANYLSTLPAGNFVIIASHKPFCETPLSEHSAFSCTTALNNEFNRLNELTIGAHNHCMAWKLGGNKALSGAGGRSHYDCSGSSWWINDTSYGYLLMTRKATHLDFVFKDQAQREISQHFILGAGPQFNTPRGIAVDSSGNVFVADTGNNQTKKFSNTGAFITNWGSTGTGNGQFNLPQGIAVDSSGNVYVADTDNHRIQKFSNTGTFIRKWGSFGTGNDQFNLPQGIAVDSSGNVFVADTNNDRIQKFSNTGAFIRQWGSFGTGNGQFNGPRDIAVDSSGNVFVADTDNHRIQKFSNTGAFIRQWGSFGTGNGQFNGPRDIAVDSSGNVFVADAENSRIQKFSNTGAFIRQWGSFGTGNGQFNLPQGIAVDSSGNVYVVDTDNHRIQKFSNTGTFITKWGSGGTGDGQFDSPTGITVDSSGNVYVADTDNHRIQKFLNTGTYITKWGSFGTLSIP